MVDLFLYNGFTPLRRSPADVFLDNGIGLLRAFLKKEKIDAVIEDRFSLEGFKAFEKRDVSMPLREVFSKMLFGDGDESSDQHKLRAVELYQSLLKYHDAEMFAYLQGLVKRIVTWNVPVVGIKLWAGSTHRYCEEFCRMIHEASPETIVVVGGPQTNCLFFEGTILKYNSFDLAIYTEGEMALAEIVRIATRHTTKRERLDSIIAADIPNLIYRRDGEVVVNKVELMDIDDKLVPDYDQISDKVSVHTIIDALGCDYGDCSFCMNPLIFKKYRARTPKLVVDEIEQMVQKGIGLYSMTASDTPLPHALKICEEIIRRGLIIEFSMLTRAVKGAATRKERLIEIFRTLIKGGLRLVFMGVESANDAVLKEGMNKGVTKEDIFYTIQSIREASQREGIHVYILNSYIFPIPLTDNLIGKGIDNQSVLKENIEFIKKTRPDSFHGAPAGVYLGSRWYEHAARYNISFEREELARMWNDLEVSFHVFVKPDVKPIYSVLGKSFAEWIPMYNALMSAGRVLGIPTDLWDEHMTLARASGFIAPKDLQQVSKDLFLDILVCDDSHTRDLYTQASLYSKELAERN